MKIALTLVLVAALSFSGCKKNGIEYMVHGTVFDQSFNTPSSGTTVSLYEYAPGSAFPTLVSSAVTGSEGEYSFTIKRDKVEKYELVIEKTNYFSHTSEFSVEDLDPKIPKIITMPIAAKSWVKLSFHNPDNVGNVKIVKTNGKTGCDECCMFSEFTLYNNVTDSTIYCINEGNSTYSYHWFKLQTTENGEASVTTVPFDTTELILNY